LLGWSAGASAIEHDIYKGTSRTAVASATKASDEYEGTTSESGWLTYLEPLTQYYWRVDTVTSSGTLTGDIWNFTTGAQLNSINLDLKLHYTLDADDISGSTVFDGSDEPLFDGTIYGATDYPDAQIAEGLNFDGINDYVAIPAMNLNTDTLTISAWIKRNGNQATDACIVFSRAGSTCAGLNFGSNNELEYHWNDSFWGWQSGLFVPDNQWSYVGMVVEPDKTTLYLNGTSSTNFGTHVVEAFDGLTAIGKDITRGDRLYKGQVDDVAIWDRALSPTEMELIYMTGLEGQTFNNRPPEFASNPFSRDDAVEGYSYDGSIAGEASDPDAGDTVVYSKVGGFDWLSVDAEGNLSGIPGDNEVGLSEFIIRAEDGRGGYDEAVLQINVLNTYSGTKGLSDFAGFAEWWLVNGCSYCGGADLTGEGSVGFDDLLIFLDNWMVDLIPVGYWNFDESTGITAADSSIYGRDGTLVNMDDNDWVGGVSGNCLEFDGIDDYVQVTGYKGISGGRSRTCSAWIKTSTTPVNIITWGNTDTTAKWIVRLDVSGALRAEVQGGYIIGSTNLTDDAWHHVAVILEDDGSTNIDEARLYVDGVEEIISLSEPCRVNTSTDNDVMIGTFSTFTRFFEGMIDEVRIYGRALNEEEIGGLMN
jgi:hypothetical protein